jgi:hypothetical protein
MTQKFKGDELELKMEAAQSPAFDATTASLDQYYSAAYTASDFLLMLYDAGRMPFSDRVPRDSFVRFIREAISRFQFTGTFEFYIFIIKSIFGEGSDVLFNVPSPGTLEMTISATDFILSDWVASDFSSGSYVENPIVTSSGDTIQFAALSGISSETQLNQLFAELIPAGIYPDITLQVFTLLNFIAIDGSDNESFVLDSSGNQIVFYQLGA